MEPEDDSDVNALTERHVFGNAGERQSRGHGGGFRDWAGTGWGEEEEEEEEEERYGVDDDDEQEEVDYEDADEDEDADGGDRFVRSLHRNIEVGFGEEEEEEEEEWEDEDGTRNGGREEAFGGLGRGAASEEDEEEDEEEEDEEEYSEEEDDMLELELEFARSRKKRKEMLEDVDLHDTVDDLLQEGQQQRRQRASKVRSRLQKRRRKASAGIPLHLQGLMGKANLLYMKKDFDPALKILRTLVREAPKGIAAYHTLGLIHEEKGETRRALDFYMIAALLERGDDGLWRKNGIASRELGNLPQAIFCFSMAMKASRGKDAQSLESLAQLRAEKGDIRLAAQAYEKLLQRHRPGDKDIIWKTVSLYESIALPEKAVQVLTTAVENAVAEGVEKQFEPDMAVKLVSRLMSLRKYEEAGALLTRLALLTAAHPTQFPLELRAWLAVCNIRLGSATPDAELREARKLLRPRAFAFRDLIFELADALLDAKHQRLAISVYDELAEQDAVDARLMLRRGSALKELGEQDRAVADLERALELSPGMVEATMLLLDLYQLRGDVDKISELLSSIEGTAGERSDAVAAAERTVRRILSFAERYENSDTHRYVETLLPLMDAACNLRRRNAADASKTKEVGPVLGDSDEEEGEGGRDSNTDAEWLFQFSQRRVGRKRQRKQDKYGFSMRDVGVAVRKVLSNEEYLQLLEKFWYAMNSVDREYEAASIISRLVYLKEVDDEKLVDRLRLLGVAASIKGRQFRHAYDEVRALCTERPDEPTFWYVLGALIDVIPDQNDKRLWSSTFKFASRLLTKTPRSLPCILAVGNSFFTSSSYRCAEALYLRAYAIEPDEPLVSLMLALTYAHQSQTRRVFNKPMCVLKGLTFLGEYRRLREDGTNEVQAEVYYNLGRFYHFCNLLHLAAPLYEKVLSIPAARVEKHLHRDAAFNLVKLYSDNGSVKLAIHILSKHLTF